MSKQKRGGARLEKDAPQRSQRKVNRALKILLIVLAVILALILIFIVVYKSWAKLPDLPDPQRGQVQTADPVTGIMPPQNVMLNSERKEGFYTFLVVGRDTGGGGNTDTMMLAAYDIPNQRLSVMSLPRDTMVDARHRDRNRKLNGVWNLCLYYAKKGEKREGVSYLKEAVGDMMGFVPDFHIVVNWEAFGRLVDAIGGVEFEVPFTMKYDDPTQNLHIDVPKGKRVLTGEEAMGVVRWRHNNSYSVGYASGDLGRIQTQQALMKEIVKKCLKIENVTKINEFAEIFTEEVDTDLTLGNLVAFAERAIFGGLKMDNVNFITMPNTPIYVGNDSYVQAKPDELLGLLNDGFNPYVDDLTMEALHILQYKSSTGYYTYSGTGAGVPPIYTDPRPAAVVNASTPEPTDSAPPEEDPEAGDDPDAESSDRPDDEESPRPSGGGAPAGIGDPDGDDDDPPETRPSHKPTASPKPSASPEPSEDAPQSSPSHAPATQPPADEPQPSAPSQGQPAGIPMD